MQNIAGCVIAVQRDSISKYMRPGIGFEIDSASTAIVHGYGTAVSASHTGGRKVVLKVLFSRFGQPSPVSVIRGRTRRWDFAIRCLDNIL